MTSTKRLRVIKGAWEKEGKRKVYAPQEKEEGSFLSYRGGKNEPKGPSNA